MSGFAVEAMASSHTPRELPDALRSVFDVHGRRMADVLHQRGLELRRAGSEALRNGLVDEVAYALASDGSPGPTGSPANERPEVADAIACLEEHMLGWDVPTTFPPSSSAYGALSSVFGSLRAAVFDHVPSTQADVVSPDVEPPDRFLFEVAPYGRAIALEAELRVDDGQIRHRGTFIVRRAGSDRPLLSIPAKTITGYGKRGAPLGVLAVLYGTPAHPVVPLSTADGPHAAAVIAAQLQGHVIRRPPPNEVEDAALGPWFQLTRAGREAWLANAAGSDHWPAEFMSIAVDGGDEVLIDPYTGRIETGEILLDDGSRAAWVDLASLPCAADAGDSGRLRLADLALVDVDGNPQGPASVAAFSP